MKKPDTDFAIIASYSGLFKPDQMQGTAALAQILDPATSIKINVEILVLSDEEAGRLMGVAAETFRLNDRRHTPGAMLLLDDKDPFAAVTLQWMGEWRMIGHRFPTTIYDRQDLQAKVLIARAGKVPKTCRNMDLTKVFKF